MQKTIVLLILLVSFSQAVAANKKPSQFQFGFGYQTYSEEPGTVLNGSVKSSGFDIDNFYIAGGLKLNLGERFALIPEFSLVVAPGDGEGELVFADQRSASYKFDLDTLNVFGLRLQYAANNKFNFFIRPIRASIDGTIYIKTANGGSNTKFYQSSGNGIGIGAGYLVAQDTYLEFSYTEFNSKKDEPEINSLMLGLNFGI